MDEVKFDLVMIGADAPGLAAAGCAAAAGAKVLVMRTGAESPSVFARRTAPNFVWRALDLYAAAPHLYAENVSAVTAFQGALAGTPELVGAESDPGRMTKLVDAMEPGGGALWADFERLAERLGDEAISVNEIARYGATMVSPLLAANDVLDDYFHDEKLKAHLAASALLPLGLAGDEPASATALDFATETNAAAWTNGRALHEALEAVCKRLEVTEMNSNIVGVAAENGALQRLELTSGDFIFTRIVMASNAELALASGLAPMTSSGQLSRAGGARAFVRLTFEDGAGPTSMADGQRIQVVDDRGDLMRARDAMAEGRLSDAPPLVCERDGDEVYVLAPYCPAAFVDEEGERPWSGQDRQAFGRQIYERLRGLYRMDEPPTSIDVRIDRLAPREPSLSVMAPPTAQDQIGATSKFALGALGLG